MSGEPSAAPLDFDHPPADPLPTLRTWLAEAAAKSGLPNPHAFSLATVDADGQPSARMVLLKHVEERGLAFFTNYESRKGVALAANPRAAALFHWDAMNRQVRVEGRVTKVSASESDAYYAVRPRESRIGAWASAQSRPVKDRAALDAAVAEVQRRFPGPDIPRPPHWGGFRLSLDRIEFWQGHPFRVHDRVLYARDARGRWSSQRLYP